jgi:tRNA pseudouridine55 synthase
MDGLILIDKPVGWTSHDAVSFLRGLLKEKRTGHTGTLDPAATGLLLVLLGKATRLAKFYGGNKKEYTATVKLGCETDTLDAEGKIIRELSVPALDRRKVEEVFSRFTGEIEQVPPAYSAVKIGGEPLYRRARKGLLVQPPPRRVTIDALELLELSGDELSFHVLCSSGTYIRSLARDISEALGTCGHLVSLRRTAAGVYRVEDALSLEPKPAPDEASKRVMQIDMLLPELPAVRLTPRGADDVCHGRPPAHEDFILLSQFREGSPVRMMGESGKLLAIGEAAGEGAINPILPKVVLS